MLYNPAYHSARETSVQRLKRSRSIQPVSEFRANAAKFIEQVRATKEAIVLTQHGRGAAVLVDIDSYEDLVEELAIRRGIERSLADEKAGRVIANEDLMAELRARYLS